LSGHPVARAVVAWCAEHEHVDVKLQESKESARKSMYGRFFSATDLTITDMLVGNAALLHDHSVPIPEDVLRTIPTWTNAARFIVLIATCTISISLEHPYRIRALLAAADPIRPRAASIINTLQTTHNIAIYMLTGDNIATATAVGRQAGIPPSNIIAGVLPEQKAERVGWLQETQFPHCKSTRFLQSSLARRK